jgi:hypothetical protein
VTTDDQVASRQHRPKSRAELAEVEAVDDGVSFAGSKFDRFQKVNSSNFYFELISDRTPGLG